MNNNDLATVVIYRSRDATPGVDILINHPIPPFDDAGWAKDALAIYRDDAERIVNALVKNLPGGTLAQVHARLCQHFADKCLLRVTGELKSDKVPDLREAILKLRTEVNCRIEHGAGSHGHLDYVQSQLDAML